MYVLITLADHSYSFAPLTAFVTLLTATISLVQLPYKQLGNQLMLFSMENSIYFTIKLHVTGMVLLHKQKWMCLQENISLSKLHITSQILDNRGNYSPTMRLQCKSPYKSNNMQSRVFEEMHLVFPVQYNGMFSLEPKDTLENLNQM